MVRLPLQAPPGLVELSGYQGSARLVALSWTSFGDELLYRDGTVSGAGDWRGWLAFVEHPLGQAVLGPYELGSSESEAAHWLLIDREDRTLDIGLGLDVQQLLASQPSELCATCDGFDAEQVEWLIDSARAERLEREMRRTPAQRGRGMRAALLREARLLDGLGRYLDDAAAAFASNRDGESWVQLRGREDPGLEIGA